MNLEKTKTKKYCKLLVLTFAIAICCIIWSNQSIAVAWNKGETGDTYISPQLMNSSGSSVGKRVSELSSGDTFWITGYGNTNKQVFRSPAIFCTEKVNSLTTAQNGSTRIKYKIRKISRVTTTSNHTSAEKGLAYLVSFSRNGGNNFGGYNDAQTNDAVQNAFWTYTANNSNNINIIENIGSSKGKNVGNASEINNHAEAYKEYIKKGVSTTANISNVKVNWNNNYSKLVITYNLKYNATNGFGKTIVNFNINYNGQTKTIKTITDGDGIKNGSNRVEIDSNDIPDEGCNITINATYSYTYVDSTICDFVDARNNPKYRGQNLVIVSGKREKKSTTSKITAKIPPKVTNVSMQKYITKVINPKGVETNYSERENKYAKNLSGDNWKWRGHNHSAKISDMSGRKEVTDAARIKQETNLEIEAGDTVEYTIEVYNNGKIATNITLYDKMINTGKVTKIVKDGKIINNTYIKESIENPTEYREGALCNFNLNGGKTAIFKVYVKYDTYHTNYSQNKLMNQAYITTNLENKTTYRTIDADYVLMKEYKVSLEKWVSNISRVRPGEEKITLIDKQYGTLINYLQNLKRKKEQLNYGIKLNELVEKYATLNSEHLKALINHYNALNLETDQYLTYDLDGDRKITQNDLKILRIGEVYSKLGENAKEIIEQYINADLNNDGNVDINDFKIYQLLKSNLYKDQGLNGKDKYLFIIKEMCKKNQFNDNTLNYLKSVRTKKIDLKYQDTMTNYIKSDIDENGIVNEDDNYTIEGNKVIIKHIGEDGQEEIKEYDLNVTEQIKNLDSNKIKELENYIRGSEQGKESYDLNDDFQINEEDIGLLTEYNNENGQYKKIREFEQNNSNIDVLEKMKEILFVDINDKSELKYLDLDENGKIDYNDIKLNLQYDDNATRIDTIIDIFENANIDTAYDFDDDKKTTYDDYELVEEYKTIENKIGTNKPDVSILQQIINDYNIYDEIIEETIKKGKEETVIFKENKNSFSENDIHVIKLYKGLKQYKKEYEKLEIEIYDFNNDDKITQEDLDVINNIQNLLIPSNYINEIESMQVEELNGFINLLTELLEDETTREQKQEEIKNINTDLNDDGTEDERDYELLKETINTSTNATETLSQEELNEKIQNSKYFYYEGSNNLVQYTNHKNNLDANEDGIIDKQDIEYLDGGSTISKDIDIEYNRGKINYFLLYDLNNDATFDNKDIEIINHLKNYDCDINGDNSYTEIDLNLLIEIKRLDTNKSDIQEIENYLNGGNKDLEGTESKREGHAEYLTREKGELVDKTDEDNEWTRHNRDKYSNVVTVQNNDYVTYTIKVKNDGDTPVYITKVMDTLPEGVQLENLRRTNDTTIEYTNLKNSLIAPKTSVTFTITVKVTESNMSIKVLRNYAYIPEDGLTNQYNVPVKDSTPWNNEDSDYIQLKDIIISGTVWNDKAFDKGQNYYDGLYNDSRDENRCELDNIAVHLYRYANGKNEKIKTTQTSNGGKYSFKEDYIKASKVTNNDYNPWPKETTYTKRWNSYYSYYIVFEYDGITYTNTIVGEIDAENYQINSNAKEDNGPVKETRQAFNNRFSTINNQSGIEYTTKNENGYIPQSNHIYNPEKMAMQSSTNLVNIGSGVTEDQLQHINLGLRGRDIFDLELTSDVYSTKVTVNGQDGEYNYNNNKVTVRRTDLYSEPQDSDKYYYNNEEVAKQDAANMYSTEYEYNDKESTNSYVQTVRNTDIDKTKTNSNYNQTGLGIEVTYKITVTNASGTQGTASKIINYFDDKYELISVYALNGNQRIDFTTEGNSQKFKNGTSNMYSIEYDNKKTVSNANSVLINTTEKRLNQGDTMDIYLVYTLNTPTTTLASLLNGTKTIPTYNMAEIYEYKTYTTNNNEATRGLLDKDSAPGSVGTEKVRLVNGTSNDTTVEYYFKAQNLQNLKYEDDTYGTPTLYFASDANGRKLSGTVFEDYTVIYGDERIKSGNGVQDAEKGEPGINGVTVELLEGNTVRYRVTTHKDEITGENGRYTFENFLPGKYTIRYRYGNEDTTFVVTDPNTKSYNGEDFQATNNTGKLGNNENNKIKALSKYQNFWYVYNENEGVSTATDNTNRRNTVSDNVVGFTDLQMKVLNNAREGKTKEEIIEKGFEVDKNGNETEVTYTSDDIKSKTSMFATTDNFTLQVEKTEINNGTPVQNKGFMNYHVQNMNFGIAEVPVTTIDLQKSIKNFTIMDSTNKNIIAQITKNTNSYSVAINPTKISSNKERVISSGLSRILGISKAEIEKNLKQAYDNIVIKDNVSEEEKTNLQNWMNEYSISEGVKIIHGWNVEGSVAAPAGANKITAQIEDAKLQGAKLEITYEIIASMYTEKNFDNSTATVPSITGIIDYIDNDLSYNETLGKNKDYWELSNYTEAYGKYANAKYECIRDGKEVTVIPKGTLDPKGTNYTTLVKAKVGNPLLLEKIGTSEPVEITLEKTLSAQDSTIMDIITSSIDTYEYDNQLEITGLNYKNTTSENGTIYRDRVRNPERYIILAGSQHDTFQAETLSIFPPTGENRNMAIYVIATISLGMIAIGIIGIRKYVLKRK